ncbi:MAG: glycosyltransferase, partial [Ferruginibacter sp.]
MKKLGLVTVLYKSDEVLKGFIKSLSIQTFSNYIVYFIDNSVNDCSTSYLLSLLNEYPTLEYKYLPQLGNIGVAAGNNVGIKATLMDHCDYILLLNNDIETEQNYLLEKIVRKAEEGNADLLVPKILYYDSRRIWMAGGFMDNFRALGVHDGMDSEDSGMFNNEKFITYAPTCFMLIS